MSQASVFLRALWPGERPFIVSLDNVFPFLIETLRAWVGCGEGGAPLTDEILRVDTPFL